MLNGVKLSGFDPATIVDGSTRFVGYRVIGGGVYQDENFTLAQLLSAITPLSFTLITITSAGSTITNAYFATAIRAITIAGQTYPISADTFTQNTGTQTIDISPLGTVAVDDVIIAWR